MACLVVDLQTMSLNSTYLYINSEQWYKWHVPSTSATVNTHANVFFVFLPGGISKEWRDIVSANCYFEGETGPIVPIMFTGLSGNTWQTAKIAHESHNDVTRLCWRHLRSAGRTNFMRKSSIYASIENLINLYTEACRCLTALSIYMYIYL